MEAAVRWSPHDEGRFLLVDVLTQSLSLNKVTNKGRNTLEYETHARYDRLPKFGAFDWSKNDVSLVALGLVSGTACIVKLHGDGQESDIAATYKLKQERKCNSIALSSQNWLATGLDKTRSDWCLTIFDANATSLGAQEPIRRLCSAEVVSSVRFFPQHPQQLVVAAQRAFIRLYDLRDGFFGSGGSGNVQIATRNVNNIAIDPLDENYFASAGSTDDPSVTIWDKRWIVQSTPGGSTSGAVFDFRPAVDNTTRTSIWSLRYSGHQRSRLAICASTGEFKVIDMAESQNSHLHGSDYLPTNPNGGTPWTCNRYVRRTRVIQKPLDGDGARQDVDGHHRLMAFDWMDGNSVEQPVIAMRRSRRIEILRVPVAVPFSEVTARHDVSVAFEDMSLAETRPDAGDMDELEESAETNASNNNDTDVIDAGGCAILHRQSIQLITMFTDSTIQQQRCSQGYLFDCERNKDIVAGNQPLESLWETLARFRSLAADGGMTTKHLDLSFFGISSLWFDQLGPSPHRRLSPTKPKFSSAVKALNVSLSLPAFEGERTAFPEYRQLALALCGWNFTPDALEAECQDLIARGQHYQAIVQAVLHDHRHTALNLLRTLIRSKTVPNIGLGPLLASDALNDAQREMCQWMAADTDDLALKALLTFLTTNNWRDVMKTPYLHLGYRVALGLRYLNDTELSGFLQSETARAVKNGDLHGILLTGLGEQGGVDLLQTYLTKTNDVQTPVLALTFAQPLYGDDVRWEMWRETYFELLQRWRAFGYRAKFAVQHAALARTRDGKGLTEAVEAQITLRCARCDASLAKPQQSGGVGTTTKVSDQPALSAGIVCPTCLRRLPRCGVCKLWLGTPDARKASGARELAEGEDNVLGKFLSFCVRCGHGYHAEHGREWFAKWAVCAIPGCGCVCYVK